MEENKKIAEQLGNVHAALSAKYGKKFEDDGESFYYENCQSPEVDWRPSITWHFICKNKTNQDVIDILISAKAFILLGYMQSLEII